MIISGRKLLKRLKYVILFLVLTYLMSYAVALFLDWIQPAHRYREPSGEAVKVLQQSMYDNGNISFTERLKLFYWYGE